jgi:hypothetical protein
LKKCQKKMKITSADKNKSAVVFYTKARNSIGKQPNLSTSKKDWPADRFWNQSKRRLANRGQLPGTAIPTETAQTAQQHTKNAQSHIRRFRHRRDVHRESGQGRAARPVAHIRQEQRPRAINAAARKR